MPGVGAADDDTSHVVKTVSRHPRSAAMVEQEAQVRTSWLSHSTFTPRTAPGGEMGQCGCGVLSLLKEPQAEGSCGFMHLGPGGSRGGLGVENSDHSLSQNREQCLQDSPEPLNRRSRQRHLRRRPPNQGAWVGRQRHTGAQLARGPESLKQLT